MFNPNEWHRNAHGELEFHHEGWRLTVSDSEWNTLWGPGTPHVSLFTPRNEVIGVEPEGLITEGRHTIPWPVLREVMSVFSSVQNSTRT